MKAVSLKQLAEHLGAELRGDGDITVSSVASLESATAGQVAFLSNPKLKQQLETTQASAVILKADMADSYSGNVLILQDPYVGFARTAQLLDTTPKAAELIHPSAVIDPSAKLGKGVAVAANAVIGANVIIGENAQIGAGTVISQDCVIGSDCILWANVTVYHNVHLGQACIIHSGAVLGSDGFGYANERGTWIKIPQTGGVRIGNRVEIGAGTTVDRGALEHTEIHDGCIIDNQVQIAHNDIIGENTAIAGCTVLAGSVTIGRYCIIGGACAISGHLTITDGVHLSGGTNVTNDVKEPGLYSSATVAMDNRLWRKNTVRFRQLDELFQRVRKLEKSVTPNEE
ncbi:UDP-3-O-(3-hydroxymyristoyl)glucosamine N-acyltransferase [Shewanella avicenniae]|uniref:UDP-3-O-acylglucosamine N-acyltransferase n=1 Tax=Shewanella avicenniae TaxID=2814294 RepID=A0ABX7QNN7_9GAMM|nr:UDP-3-O-(3-hydroxymyristoyl)glucosamine N-acyltransferase [Shewanella avicenniae]QSX32505.1 UDP-3-O-(3-hydroxymyristoyl)glucosamine N-acyltransferase [Shewanella avicenniae]